MSEAPTPCTDAEIRRLNHRFRNVAVSDVIKWAQMLERSREEAYQERDQLATQCIALVKQLSELEGFEELKGFVDKNENAEQADALHEIHKEDMPYATPAFMQDVVDKIEVDRERRSHFLFSSRRKGSHTKEAATPIRGDVPTEAELAEHRRAVDKSGVFK